MIGFSSVVISSLALQMSSLLLQTSSSSLIRDGNKSSTVSTKDAASNSPPSSEYLKQSTAKSDDNPRSPVTLSSTEHKSPAFTPVFNIVAFPEEHFSNSTTCPTAETDTLCGGNTTIPLTFSSTKLESTLTASLPENYFARSATCLSVKPQFSPLRDKPPSVGLSYIPQLEIPNP
ncbi:hypothetical protein AVEN_272309-1 [Araneus ventricosus]|uniref:Uncharacterized protein n=1 Tax=Araneus ventricosus TaxID=182803 RepID=A0A4Y2RAR1_ARAVE|nr:hypothetical protein AVEN_272309-1 [Araneus ventricosus]